MCASYKIWAHNQFEVCDWFSFNWFRFHGDRQRSKKVWHLQHLNVTVHIANDTLEKNGMETNTRYTISPIVSDEKMESIAQVFRLEVNRIRHVTYTIHINTHAPSSKCVKLYKLTQYYGEVETQSERERNCSMDKIYNYYGYYVMFSQLC